jgi:hypothetical protein
MGPTSFCDRCPPPPMKWHRTPRPVFPWALITPRREPDFILREQPDIPLLQSNRYENADDPVNIRCPRHSPPLRFQASCPRTPILPLSRCRKRANCHPRAPDRVAAASTRRVQRPAVHPPFANWRPPEAVVASKGRVLQPRAPPLPTVRLRKRRVVGAPEESIVRYDKNNVDFSQLSLLLFCTIHNIRIK